MAQKITVALEDDLEGGPADETVRFELVPEVGGLIGRGRFGGEREVQLLLGQRGIGRAARRAS